MFHVGVLAPPQIKMVAEGRAFIPDQLPPGLRHLVLEGEPYSRGLAAGQLTKDLLLRQERELNAALFKKIPEWLLKVLEIPLIRYFWGIEKYVEPWMLQEMYGVAQSAPHEFDRLIDGYTRQLVYHGLHEVGQMMVDSGQLDMGCTVVAMQRSGERNGGGWILGRNFDFEGGRTLDREKIVKWTFPHDGLAFVSVVWAGMVGGVTAVNERGLYLSINAAGSTEHRRYGMPSTLLLVKVMKEARTALEAIEILRAQPMFITDIFVLLDSATGQLYRIEKSPATTEVLELKGPSVVANHLISEHFKNDRVNLRRQQELTTLMRQQRAEQRLTLLNPLAADSELEIAVLGILRDKGENGGKPLHLGHRAAIDALIATHSVIYNSRTQVLFVSHGPAVSGPFSGFDLRRSFAQRRPVKVGELPSDPHVPEGTFEHVRASAERVARLRQLVRNHQCAEVRASLADSEKLYPSYGLKWLQGEDSVECRHDLTYAKTKWQQALNLAPAYAEEREALKQRLEREEQ